VKLAVLHIIPILFITFLLTSCATAPNFTIDNIRFYEINHDVLAPCDLPEAVSFLTSAIEFKYSKKIAHEVMNVDVFLYPGYQQIYSPIWGTVTSAGIYEPDGTIRLRILGPSVLDTAFIHEIMQHRLPHVLERTTNSSHHPKWIQAYHVVLKAILPILNNCR